MFIYFIFFVLLSKVPHVPILTLTSAHKHVFNVSFDSPYLQFQFVYSAEKYPWPRIRYDNNNNNMINNRNGTSCKQIAESLIGRNVLPPGVSVLPCSLKNNALISPNPSKNP